MEYKKLVIICYAVHTLSFLCVQKSKVVKGAHFWPFAHGRNRRLHIGGARERKKEQQERDKNSPLLLPESLSKRKKKTNHFSLL